MFGPYRWRQIRLAVISRYRRTQDRRFVIYRNGPRRYDYQLKELSTNPAALAGSGTLAVRSVRGKPAVPTWQHRARVTTRMRTQPARTLDADELFSVRSDGSRIRSPWRVASVFRQFIESRERWWPTATIRCSMRAASGNARSTRASRQTVDRRWVRIRRPSIVIGGGVAEIARPAPTRRDGRELKPQLKQICDRRTAADQLAQSGHESLDRCAARSLARRSVAERRSTGCSSFAICHAFSRRFPQIEVLT